MGRRVEAQSRMSDAPFHPGLHRHLADHRRLMRLLTLSSFLVMAGAMVFAMTTALQGNTVGDVLLLVLTGGVVLLMVVILGSLSWFLDRRMMQRLTEANRLLDEQRPQAARLTPIRRIGQQAALMRLQLLGAPGATDSYQVLIKPSTGGNRPPPQDRVVQVYSQNLQPGTRLVAMDDSQVWLGRLVDGQTEGGQRHWILLVVMVAVGVLVIMM